MSHLPSVIMAICYGEGRSVWFFSVCVYIELRGSSSHQHAHLEEGRWTGHLTWGEFSYRQHMRDGVRLLLLDVVSLSPIATGGNNENTSGYTAKGRQCCNGLGEAGTVYLIILNPDN
uniref:Uncharacterized protein n=1 Tax=Lactuca sativa TaxID=4236 RepID=A0A9R1XVU9_LACSA|nr:hypothetical protein LSAT_V11C100015300 [Lactuca sativa]